MERKINVKIVLILFMLFRMSESLSFSALSSAKAVSTVTNHIASKLPDGWQMAGVVPVIDQSAKRHMFSASLKPPLSVVNMSFSHIQSTVAKFGISYKILSIELIRIPVGEVPDSYRVQLLVHKI